MARYRVQGPDGAIHVFEGPDNATPADVEAFAAQTFGAKASAKSGKAAEKRHDPTDGMSPLETFAAGVGKGMTDLAYGVGQMIPVRRNGKWDTLVTDQDVAEKRRIDAPLMNTTGGQVGNFAGNVAVALPTMFIPGANTLTGAALVGAGQGLLQPTAAGESRLTNAAIGGASGAGGVAAGRALVGAYQGSKALVEPFMQAGRDKIAGRTILRFASDPAKVATAQGGQTLTGALPTVAEVTGDAGMARLQDAVRSMDPQISNQLVQRLADNNAARVNSLTGLAGDSTRRAAAESAREAASKDLYQQATKAAYTVDGALEELLKRPAVQQAMARAKTLATNQGRTVAFDVNPSNAFSGVGVPTNSTRQINGQALQDLKMAMDEMLTDPASGFTGKAGNTIKDLRGQLINWMESANPAFKAARTAYRDASKPLNAMDIGAEVARRATSNTSDLAGNPRMQANALLGMLRDEGGLIERATGRKGLGNKLADILTPDQLATLRAVASETDRAAAVASTGAGPGSATAQRLASQNILRQLVGPTGLPQSWAESALANTVIGKPLNLLYGGVAEPKIQQALAEAVLDPARAAALVSRVQPAQQQLPPSVVRRLATDLASQAVRLTPSTLAVTGQR